jgi:hypothetical protein
MEIHPFTAKHSFVDRVRSVSLHCDIAFLIFMDDYATPDTAIATGAGKGTGMRRV